MCVEPCAGGFPVTVDSPARDAQRGGNLVFIESGEVAHFDDAAGTRAQFGKLGQGFVKLQELVVGLRSGDFNIGERERFLASAAADGGAGAGVVDQHSPHRLGADSKKVGAILELKFSGAGESEVGLMNERRWGKCVSVSFHLHTGCRYAA